MPDTIGTAKIYYTNGNHTNFPMTSNLQKIMEKFVEYASSIGHGNVVKIISMGTYNPNSRLPNGAPSEHAYSPPRAIDVAEVQWADGEKVNSLDRPGAKKIDHLAVEACLRLAGFGCVLGYDYNSDHHNHWHCDYSIPFGMAGTSQKLFAKRVMDYIACETMEQAQARLHVAIDGSLGPQTLGAMCKFIIGDVAKQEEPAFARPVYLNGEFICEYTMQGDSAWVPLRAFIDGMGLELDVTEWPKIKLGD